MLDLNTLKSLADADFTPREIRALVATLENPKAKDKTIAENAGISAANYSRLKPKLASILKTNNPLVLDICCGSSQWYEPEQPENIRIIKCDLRYETIRLKDRDKNRTAKIAPDIQANFKSLPFKNETFNLVAFDPPHLTRAGEKSYYKAKYGLLESTWKDDLKKAFSEAFRVLKKGGTLILKWAAISIPIKDVLALSPIPPILGTQRPNGSKTYWKIFIKP